MRIGSDDINGHPVPFGYRNYSTLADFIDEQELNRIMDRYTRGSSGVDDDDYIGGDGGWRIQAIDRWNDRQIGGG